jgi:hypothetical protein
MPEPVTKRDAVDRILAETSLSDDALERMGLLPLDLSDLTPLDEIADALELRPLEEIASDLVDLDRLIAETSPPLDNATVVALVAEALDRDPQA